MEFAGKTILITGAAGFIGFYLAKRILEENPTAKVVGYDSVNDYYRSICFHTAARVTPSSSLSACPEITLAPSSRSSTASVIQPLPSSESLVL